MDNMQSQTIRLGFTHQSQLVQEVAFEVGSEMSISIGREAAAQIHLPFPAISSKHAQINLNAFGQLSLIDVGSTNGTYLNGQRLEVGIPYLITAKDSIEFAQASSIFLVFNPEETEISPNLKGDKTEFNDTKNLNTTRIIDKFNGKDLIKIGRSSDSDVVIPHSSVSRNHATIEKKNGHFYVKDLGSTNGTYLNGNRIQGSAKISEDDILIIGRYKLSLKGKAEDLTKEVAIRAIKIEKKFSNQKIGLHESSFDIPSKSLLAVMGPSGCGKSTLLKALNGDAPPSSGTVLISGLELSQHFDYLKTQIGYVPQDDIVHRELTVEQSLYFAAKLRLIHADKDFIDQKIEGVLKDLNIEHIRHNLVGKISGGQRKRVSIAVEILTDPLILFLDEPTSPLDPQTIEEFLGILRSLSQKGTTVIMVTHKPEDLNYMDSVIFMAEGGHMVYFESTKKYLEYFKVKDTVQVYAQLVQPKSEFWISEHTKNGSKIPENTAQATRKINRTRVNFFNQFSWLTRRYFKIKLNDKVNTAFMILQAPIIAGLICLIFESISQAVPFLMAISAIWFGTNNAAREIVGEAPIFKRERMFNQGILPYMFSKITVLGSFAAIQSGLFTLIIYLNFSGTDLTWNDPIQTFSWMLLLSISASMMGLFISSVVSTTEKVMTLVPIALIPQIMLAGVVAKIDSKIVELLSYITLSRWGTEGFSIIQKTVTKPKLEVLEGTGFLNRKTGEFIPPEMIQSDTDTTASAIDELSANFHASYAKTFGEAHATFNLDLIAVSILLVVFFFAIYFALKQKDSMKIN